MIYGLSVIVTGQIAKSRWSEKLDRLSTAWFWFAQGLSFVFFMITASRFSLALIPLFLAYSFYFLALHNLSVQYQKRVGSESFAAIASARGIVAIFIISTGEMVVGWTASFLSVGGEGTIRSGFCLIVGIVIAIKSLTAGPK